MSSTSLEKNMKDSSKSIALGDFADAFDDVSEEENVEKKEGVGTPLVRSVTPNNDQDTSTEPRIPLKKRLFDTKGKRYAWYVLLFSCFLTCIVLLSRSLQKLESTQYGIEYNIHRKKLDDAAKSGGLHLGPPGFRFIKFPSTYITVDLPDGICVSKDGIRIGFSVTFQYQMPSKWLLYAVIKYRNYEKWVVVVEAAGESAVQHACSEFYITNFQNKRGEIQSTMEKNLRTKLQGINNDGDSGVYANAISVQLRNIDLPDEYQTAVAEKQTAAEEIELAKNQRTQEKTKADTKLETAKEQSKKILDTATNDANITLTEALLKAEETLYAFETEADVLVRVKAAMNLTTNGLLSYMANQLVADVKTLSVNTYEPAKLSRKDEL